MILMSLNTNPENATITISVSRKMTPVLICLYLSCRTFTIMSVPPVVALLLNTIATPTPTRTLPAIVAIRRSSVSAPRCASLFVKYELSRIEKNVEAINLIPYFHRPRNIIGTFIIK